MLNSKILNIIGLILFLLGLSMLPSALWNITPMWSMYDANSNIDIWSDKNFVDFYSICLSSFITTLFGLVLYFITRNIKKTSRDLSSRDGFIIVAFGWIAMAVFSALPFYLSNIYNLSYTDSFFEAMSGLTTTGASILGSTTYISELSLGLQFWRSFTHFIGGMGIIVFSIAILPLLGIGGVQLFRAEVAGPVAEKITPRVKQTAKLLWGIYVGLVLFLTIVLKFEGFSWHQSFCHSFGTLATGGFSTFDNSLLLTNHDGSLGVDVSTNIMLVQWTFIVFMFIAATNFTLHYYFISKKRFDYFKDEEFKTYIFIFTAASLTIFLNIFFSTSNQSILQSFTDSTFTTISILTTTGYGTINYETWPNASKMIIFFMFFIGGTAGSTTGGIKIIRSILVLKYISYELKKLIHPKGVYNIRVGNNVIADDVVKTTLGFYLFYIFIFVFTSIIFALFGQDVVTSLTASASSIGNIGPGMGDIGPYDNWSHFPNALKWISCFCMLLGRLEIFTVMVLFSKTFWKS